LAKEFFQLIVKELFDPNYGINELLVRSIFDDLILGMFIYVEESRIYWFNQNSLETSEEFNAIGKVA
jgi:hypothetical protein